MNIKDTIKNARTQGANRPFGAVQMTIEPTDPAKLVICNDPLPTHRASPGNKYHSVFGVMKPGQCLKCKPDEVGRIQAAMRKYVQVRKIKVTVRTIKDYGDGKGRVWMLPIENKLKVGA